ncbi:MAG: asparaginase domain-containing protein [Desulfobacula sp.]|uniref:asparaginase domain-containing protein n=1 Tax=Desulfobacula sp. TaxID=2593537 RepID=UPI0025BB934B|nr:asparaginase domain-containing protein [Desulfobacula sp.]MCD4718443.1 asparaginase domain-containing protein [Desulfobacula sp.]
MKIKFFAVGGTIDKVYFDALSKYEVGESNISNILKDARVNFDYDVSSLLKKDSLEMTDQDRLIVQQAVKNESNDKIIITHGTDTMIETAQILGNVKNKVIVLTGAMEPAKFKSSDAIFNLGSAVAAVQTLPHGIYLAISGRIFTPDNVKKNRTLKVFEKKM